MNFRRTLSLVAALGVTLLASGCATLKGQGVVVTNCVSDPLTQSLECVDFLGQEFTVAWAKSANYVCRPPDQDAILVNATRLK